MFKIKNTNSSHFLKIICKVQLEKRSEIDGKIDWRMGADNINNLVKALTKPYPGAYFLIKEKKITV